MTIQQYITKLNSRFITGISREHSYRGDLSTLIEGLCPDMMITNEPARVACGAPDYIITKGNIPVGYIEAKDIGADLYNRVYKEQFDRYRKSLNNLIITDYLTFQLFRDGQQVTVISIGQIIDSKIKPIPGNFKTFTEIIHEFCSYGGQTIQSASSLSKMMAGKARLLADVIEQALTSDNGGKNGYDDENTSIQAQFESFKNILIHDITEKGFADIYAQTIAYGMFAARLHDPSPDTFSRQEAANLIPKSNPFLRKLFQYIAGYDLDDRIMWIVDALADIFRATDLNELLKDFGKATRQQDPIIHFYETFLSEYDPKLRKSRGVWYTPEPVVKFIVRAVDDILKKEFNLPQGLADNSRTRIKVNIQGKKVEQEVHKLQILDPAAGTGTFLAEIIKHIYSQFEGQHGIWNNYVENHLIPRLNGFEILMASYAMAHLKLDLLLRDTGFESKSGQRFRVYLTNSLEEYHPDTGTLFASWLSAEANEANHIKRDTPVMVIIGNPPYSGESANKGEWIMKLMDDYKKEPGGKEKLKERNPKWINDDYVKFLRYGQNYIEKNGSGILAFINPHGYLDNPTFRGMRWNLLKTYDSIYTIDLHGNTKKKEVSPDGSKDENVFDIQQGVSINLFIKTGQKRNNDLGVVFHADLHGLRSFKYELLLQKSILQIDFNKIHPMFPMFYFVQKDFSSIEKYDKGFKINDLFIESSVGIVTANDSKLINSKIPNLRENIINHYNQEADERFIKRIYYRPFDLRYIYYDSKLVERPRENISRNMLKEDNYSLNICKYFKTGDTYQHVFIANAMTESCYVSNRTSEITSFFPLYLYSEYSEKRSLNLPDRVPNLNPDYIIQFESFLGLVYLRESEFKTNTFSAIDILDYIYAILHSPSYREKYKELLKIDFPKIPYPKSQDTFWQLVKFGSELRQIHLFKSSTVDSLITQYPIGGNNIISKPIYQNGMVYINDTQYFNNVPEIAWEFYIGAYQPAQKWLKDRKGRELSFEDIVHYQKIIVALVETKRLMELIDQIDFL